jgi:hypothetical protein
MIESVRLPAALPVRRFFLSLADRPSLLSEPTISQLVPGVSAILPE